MCTRFIYVRVIAWAKFLSKSLFDLDSMYRKDYLGLNYEKGVDQGLVNGEVLYHVNELIQMTDIGDSVN